MLRDTLGKVAGLRRPVARYVFARGRVAGGSSRFTLLQQQGRNFGARLAGAFRQLLARHPSAIIIGADSPGLSAPTLERALQSLRRADAVLGPCPDGGYYLIGLRRYRRGLFSGIRWGSRFALDDTLANLAARSFSWVLLEPLEDVDRPADLRRLAATLMRRAAARDRCPAVWEFIQTAFRIGGRVKRSVQWRS